MYQLSSLSSLSTITIVVYFYQKMVLYLLHYFLDSLYGSLYGIKLGSYIVERGFIS
jgi:hypothetical protein